MKIFSGTELPRCARGCVGVGRGVEVCDWLCVGVLVSGLDVGVSACACLRVDFLARWLLF